MKTLITAAIVSISFIYCTPARIALNDNEWHTKTEYAVEGRKNIFSKESLSFGAFHTTKVKRSWTKTNTSHSGFGFGTPGTDQYQNILLTEYINKKQSLHFSLADDQKNSSDVFCLNNVKVKDVLIGNNKGSLINIVKDIHDLVIQNSNEDNLFIAQVYVNSNDTPWEMLIDNVAAQAKPNSYVGYLSKSKTEYYSIIPINKMKGKNGEAASIFMGSVGFEFRDKNNKPVAAISTIDKGMVYFSDISAEEKFILSNACAALLMREDI